jgi:molybdopterin-binding protein
VDTSALNQLPGTITEIVQTPDGLEVSVDVGFPLLTRVTSEGLHHLSISPGDSVYAGFKATAVKYIESE